MTSFSLLGTMQVTGTNGTSTPSAPKQRQVLAMLLLNANRVVRADQLIDELWEHRPPASALPTLQTYIYQLRRMLGQGEKAEITPSRRHLSLLTSQGGYQLRLGPEDSFDVHEFVAGVERGRTEMAQGLVEEAAATLRAALDRWHGPALADVGLGPLLSVEAARLAETRMSALELRLEADLQLGRHDQLIGELTALVAAHPTHESYSTLLMTALHRCGRRGPALEVYQRMRSELIDQLGLEPSAETKRLHQAILVDDPSIAAPTAVIPTGLVSGGCVPAQLPADLPDFVGHGIELARLREWAATDCAGGPQVVAVTGRIGVGKTAFAVHAAHQLRRLFPDGQLYVDLRAIAAGDRGMADVLAGFLRAVGVRSPLAGYSAAELGSMFRTWSADRQILLVVDHVGTAAQLRELLPSGRGSMVLATSLRHLGGLPGLRTIELPLLEPVECLTLLGTMIGPDRVLAELDAASEVAALCDHLPLALVAAGTRLTSRPTWSVARLVGRLRCEEDRLRELREGGTALVSTTAASYRQLASTQQRAFRIIAARPGAMRPVTAAHLLGMGESAAEAVLERLVDARLVEEHPLGPVDRQTEADGCASYHVPALIRLIARTLAAEEEPDAQAR
ncbi:MAG TPA: BTAD domain-containing putative transcriptional regulator [Mycobacteriales bacterium]|nr:BTAD domain-containing putative transcriptional regulator [Mycobacteriales bacterium]